MVSYVGCTLWYVERTCEPTCSQPVSPVRGAYLGYAKRRPISTTWASSHFLSLSALFMGWVYLYFWARLCLRVLLEFDLDIGLALLDLSFSIRPLREQ